MKLKTHQRLTDASDSQLRTADGTSASGPDVPAANEIRNILVSHGIHGGRFPIGGLTVRDARRLLTPLINIDAEAIAVINGSPVTEETTIDNHVTMLSFVKPSSIRGNNWEQLLPSKRMQWQIDPQRRLETIRFDSGGDPNGCRGSRSC